MPKGKFSTTNYEEKQSAEKRATEIDIAISVNTMRFSRRWTQKELAKRVNTSQSAIARLESGWNTPSLKLLKKIAETFDKDLRVSFEEKLPIPD